MDDRGRDLLVRGIAAAKANSLDEARFFLEKCLRMEPPLATRVQAWRYLAQIASDEEEKRRYLGMILAVDPTDGLARRDLAILNGTLDPGDVINPERVPDSETGTEPTTGKRMACPQCGAGRMFFSPDGQSLACEHCGYSEPIGPSSHAGDSTVDNHDFATTMWTAKGRRSPESTQSFTCSGCSGSFLLAPGVLSWTCPYCHAVHVDSQPEGRELIPPEAVIPFGIPRHDAADALDRWQRDETTLSGLDDLAGLYLPVWMFSFGGLVDWRGVEHEPLDFQSKQPTPVSGELTLLERHALVCATAPLPATLQPLLESFDLTKLVPYDPKFLADWPAETYRLTLDEATISARRVAIAAIKESAPEELSGVQRLEMSFSRMGVDAYKLLLLPFWVARFGDRFGDNDDRRLAMVNGQTGAVAADVETGGFLASLSRLFGN
jgi:hypothetical protein